MPLPEHSPVSAPTLVLPFVPRSHSPGRRLLRAQTSAFAGEAVGGTARARVARRGAQWHPSVSRSHWVGEGPHHLPASMPSPLQPQPPTQCWAARCRCGEALCLEAPRLGGASLLMEPMGPNPPSVPRFPCAALVSFCEKHPSCLISQMSDNMNWPSMCQDLTCHSFLSLYSPSQGGATHRGGT